MAADADARYAFNVEWFDQVASLIRPYILYFFPGDKTIEMYDVKNRRSFLKRCEYPSVQLKDIFVGAVLTIYARQLKVVDYSDDFTRKAFAPKRGKSLLVIKPDAYEQIGKILDALTKDGFVFSQLRMLRLTQAQVEAFLAAEAGSRDYASKVRQLKSNSVLVAEVINEDCVNRLLVSAESLRARFGDCVHVSGSEAAAQAETGYFFGAAQGLAARFESTARLRNCTCVVVRPHAVLAGYTGQIIDGLLEQGFDVSAIELFTLDKVAAEEFLEIYKGVLPEYAAMVDSMVTGPLVAIEVCGDQAVEKVRAYAGPMDPEIARHLRPQTLRARFGSDKISNAVHCTDLPEDGVLESEYFFQILKQAK